MKQHMIRCPWADKDRLSQQYHDNEWGVPLHDDKQLFKMLILEGKQAGLSWSLILNRREKLCLAFDDFDPAKLITYDDRKLLDLWKTDGVIKNKLKIKSVVTNAFAYFDLCKEVGSLDCYLWSFVENQPIVNHWETAQQVPSRTELSDKISKDLKKRGFTFVGSTIVYSYMQAIGMVNDHLVSCTFRNVLENGR